MMYWYLMYKCAGDPFATVLDRYDNPDDAYAALAVEYERDSVHDTGWMGKSYVLPWDSDEYVFDIDYEVYEPHPLAD